jgi:hypothetical protein
LAAAVGNTRVVQKQLVGMRLQAGKLAA